MWTCPNCSGENDDDAPACAVCATRPQPVAGGARPSVSPYPRPAGPSHPAAADPWAPDVEPITPLPPAPADPPPDGPPRRPLPIGWILAAALVFLFGVGVAAAIVVPRLLSSGDGTPARAGGTSPATVDPATADPTEAATSDPVTEDPVTEEPTGTTPPAPASSGIVAIDPSIAGDDRAAAVAAMFDTYFSGINDKDYNAVGSVLDPTGSVNPDDPRQMADLARGTRSTTDSGVTLTTLSGAGGALTAEVTFRSNQAPGDGPRGRTAETCTDWDIRYTVSGAPAAYRIRRSKASSAPC